MKEIDEVPWPGTRHRECHGQLQRVPVMVSMTNVVAVSSDAPRKSGDESENFSKSHPDLSGFEIKEKTKPQTGTVLEVNPRSLYSQENTSPVSRLGSNRR